VRRVLITGVRGKTGAALAAVLAAQRDVEVLGGSSDPARVEIDGVHPTTFSWSDREGWPAAVDRIDAIYVVRPDRADAPELIDELLDLTPQQAHVVLLSELDRDYFAPDDWAPRTERAVRNSGRTWTMLRPGWFMQVFTDPRFLRDDLLERGRLAFPGGGQAVSWIDARDIADVAAHALLEDGHRGAVYELTGPEALSLPRTAELLAAGLGRPVEYVQLSIADALSGTDGFDRRNDEGAYDRIRLGMNSLVTDTVERVTGKAARTFGEFVAGRLSPVTGDRAAVR
jgi:uncharacterized protein YbjT (DUF2867 family)